jgi:hypothetical protein
MNTDERITHASARKNVRDWAKEAYDDDPANPYPDDTAHEQVDGCEYVIYYHKARELFFDSSEVREYEDEVAEYAKPESTIDERIAICVYLWLRNEWMEAWRECESNSQPTEPDPYDEENE